MKERMIVCGIIWAIQATSIMAWEGGKWIGRKIVARRKRR